MFLSKESPLPLSSLVNTSAERAEVLLSKQTVLVVLQVTDPFAKTPLCFLPHLQHFPLAAPLVQACPTPATST